LKSGVSYNYYFEVFDNDALQNFKSSRSSLFSYRKQTQEEIENEQLQKQENTIKSLDRSLENIKDQAQRINQEYVGIFRNKDLLNKALEKFDKLYQDLSDFRISDVNLTLGDQFILYYEVRNLLTTSIVSCFSALNRKESRGSHFREDYTIRDDSNFICHSIVKRDVNKKLHYLKRKIRDKFLNENIKIEIKKREY